MTTMPIETVCSVEGASVLCYFRLSPGRFQVKPEVYCQGIGTEKNVPIKEKIELSDSHQGSSMPMLNILLLREDLHFLSHNDTVAPLLLSYFLPLLSVHSRKRLADASIPPEKSAELIPLFNSFQQCILS